MSCNKQPQAATSYSVKSRALGTNSKQGGVEAILQLTEEELRVDTEESVSVNESSSHAHSLTSKTSGQEQALENGEYSDKCGEIYKLNTTIQPTKA